MVAAQGFIPVEYIYSEGTDYDIETDRLILTLVAGDSRNLYLGVTPFNATIKELFCESSNTDVVTVTNSGIVKAMGVGEATIAVRSADQSYTQVLIIYITVVNVAQGEISISPHSLDFLQTGDTEWLAVVYINPDYPGVPVYIADVKWTTSNDMVVSINESGMLTALSPGNAVITATTPDMITATCHATVSPNRHFVDRRR